MALPTASPAQGALASGEVLLAAQASNYMALRARLRRPERLAAEAPVAHAPAARRALGAPLPVRCARPETPPQHSATPLWLAAARCGSGPLPRVCRKRISLV